MQIIKFRLEQIEFIEYLLNRPYLPYFLIS